MKGALPPSSIEHFITWSAACLSRMRPTSVEPVKVSLRTAGFSQNSLPISEDEAEGTTLKTPAGMPARSASTPSTMADSGVSFGGTRDEGTAGGQRGAGLAGDHRVGEVPRRDRGGDADRLLDDLMRLSRWWPGMVSP